MEEAALAVIPQCVRWDPEHLDTIRAAAAKDGERVGPWIRAAVLERAERLAHKESVPRFPKETLPSGKIVLCVRFRPVALDKVKAAAKAEGIALHPWIRTVAHAKAARS